MRNVFGQKLRKLREVRGISQTELSKRIGYISNSYIADVERGAYVPSEEKLRKIARSLDVSYDVVKEMALESRLDGLGIREPSFVNLLKDYPRLTHQDRREIIKTYLKVKAARDKQNGPNN